jgi:hypothetical protein
MAKRAKSRTGFKVPAQLDALPDPLDFRDRMFQASLVEVPIQIPLESYLEAEVPVLDQGTEGACTGFGLATVANYLLRRRKVTPDTDCVSPRMFYNIAKRYDEWPGEAYSGSSARGAMKGWHKHGVCSDTLWKYEKDVTLSVLTNTRVADAARRPLGAYYRVNHQDVVAMHTALAEVGVLYATATVHEGWSTITSKGLIKWNGKQRVLGGHAFAIVAYDARGFWIQNSWDTDWGRGGFGLISYDDWLLHATDVWVARLGAPVNITSPSAAAVGMTPAAQQSRSYVFADLRPHIISVGNDGRFRTSGTYGTSAKDAGEIINEDFARLTSTWTKRPKKLLLYAHGGLVPEETAIQRVADYRSAFLREEIYPLAFIWKTDYWTTLGNILQDAFSRRRPEGFLDSAKDFLLDRLDDALEPLARALTGKAQWDEMKENALLASSASDGAARAVFDLLKPLVTAGECEIHIVAHSAGAIFMAGLMQLFTASKLTVRSCTLWAPACTTELFETSYAKALREKHLDRFALFTLTDKAERDDHCAKIYHKSLLYLVSHAFEQKLRIPLIRGGEPLLGMETFAKAAMASYLKAGAVEWIKSPNTRRIGDPAAAHATAHGGFDDDQATVRATLARILNAPVAPAEAFAFHRSGAGAKGLRRSLMSASA